MHVSGFFLLIVILDLPTTSHVNKTLWPSNVKCQSLPRERESFESLVLLVRPSYVRMSSPLQRNVAAFVPVSCGSRFPEILLHPDLEICNSILWEHSRVNVKRKKVKWACFHSVYVAICTVAVTSAGIHTQPHTHTHTMARTHIHKHTHTLSHVDGSN